MDVSSTAMYGSTTHMGRGGALGRGNLLGGRPALRLQRRHAVDTHGQQNCSSGATMATRSCPRPWPDRGQSLDYFSSNRQTISVK
jgi:hypothetical protein